MGILIIIGILIAIFLILFILGLLLPEQKQEKTEDTEE